MVDLLTFGEALVEVMRTGVDQPLSESGPFTGPHESGAPFIFAVQAARLGASVAAIGCVGGDHFGRFMTNRLASEGIDTRGIQVMPDHATGLAFVAYSADGSRDYVFYVRDAAPGQLRPEHLEEALFKGLKCLHITGSAIAINENAVATGLRALELARAAGAAISFDPNMRPQLISVERARTVFAPFLEAADVVTPTVDEALMLTGAPSVGEALDLLSTSAKGKLDRVVIMTYGKEGCTVSLGRERTHVPGYTVHAVDPTGAGDCFDAGFLVRWLAGDSPVDAARFANACGALAVTVNGPMAGAHRLDEVELFMRARQPL